MVLNSKQNLEEALAKLKELSRNQTTLAEIWQEKFPEKDFNSSPMNKGKDGQLVELILDMTLSSDLHDFIDGELKTSGTLIDKDGNLYPKETMAITQIASSVDEILQVNFFSNFEDSRLYKKICNFVYLPIIKPILKDRKSWYIGNPVHIQLVPGTEPYETLKKDYFKICKQIQTTCILGQDLETTSGEYIQIRSKDSKRKSTGKYNPIYSNLLKKEIANKNYAFYFKKDFLIDALEGKFSISHIDDPN